MRPREASESPGVRRALMQRSSRSRRPVSPRSRLRSGCAASNEARSPSTMAMLASCRTLSLVVSQACGVALPAMVGPNRSCATRRRLDDCRERRAWVRRPLAWRRPPLECGGCGGSAQVQVQELIEVAARIVAEGLAVDEAATAIEAKRRIDGLAAAGLQAEALQASRARLADDVLQDRGGHALAQAVGMG